MTDEALNKRLDDAIIADASYQIYELLPQDFEIWAPPLLLSIICQSVTVDVSQRNGIQIDQSLHTGSESIEKRARLLKDDTVLCALLRTCCEKKCFTDIRKYIEGLGQPIFKLSFQTFTKHRCTRELNDAYTRDFIGQAHTVFLSYLESETKNQKNLYARAVSVIQSSGTGKSRMLTEVGKFTFTFPMCIRSNPIGFPVGDGPIYDYFNDPSHDIDMNNDMSTSAHVYTACFLEALYIKALERLRELYNEFPSSETVLKKWHDEMELEHPRVKRRKFYHAVCEKAKGLKKDRYPEKLPISPKCNTASEDWIERMRSTAKRCYTHTLAAVTALLDFIKNELDHKAVCITYIDEAPELGSVIWVLMRLLNQSKDLDMWYVFMSTQSNLDYFSPTVENMPSLRLKREVEVLLPPYYVLGFDQNISTHQVQRGVTMKELSRVSYLAKYGRPLWGSYTEISDEELIEIAAIKLTNCSPAEEIFFDTQSVDVVLAVLSQRLCIDTVVGPGEPSRLADRSISNHMRLLTGLSLAGDSNIYHTQSPSEPILTLAAFHLLYNITPSVSLSHVLHTFNTKLCSAGLVENDLIGGLAARFLLLTARDLAAPKDETTEMRNVRKPVRLLSVLEELFGRRCWDVKFEEGLKDVYVNLTHWGRMNDNLPEVLDKNILAGYWFRGSGLQCVFDQEPLLFIVTYNGSVDDDAVFDCDKLSACVIQVKLKKQPDTTAMRSLRPIGIPRGNDPLPYLAIVMELGCKSAYRSPSSSGKPQIQFLSPKAVSSKFVAIREKRLSAKRKLDLVKNTKSTDYLKRKKEFQAAQREEDQVNRYEINVRGSTASTYEVLRSAGIEKEFEAMLKMMEMTMPFPIYEPAEAMAQMVYPFSSPSDPKEWIPSCYDEDAMITDD